MNPRLPSAEPAPPVRPPRPAPPAGAAMPAVCGPSFPRTTKLLATLLVAALAAWAPRLWAELQTTAWSTQVVVCLAAASVIVVAGYWIVLTGETSIDGEAIRQRALWPKRVALAEITQVKLIRIPGLDAIVVPRLLVRTKGFGVTTFTAGDARLVQAFRALVHGPD